MPAWPSGYRELASQIDKNGILDACTKLHHEALILAPRKAKRQINHAVSGQAVSCSPKMLEGEEYF